MRLEIAELFSARRLRARIGALIDKSLDLFGRDLIAKARLKRVPQAEREREDVGARRQGGLFIALRKLSGDLGREIARRPRDHHLGFFRGHAEIEQDGEGALLIEAWESREEDIIRLHVLMANAGRVHGVEGLGERLKDLERLGAAERPAIDSRRERLAFIPRHHEPEPPLKPAVILELHDGGMEDRSDGAKLFERCLSLKLGARRLMKEL